jgi:hypothetical protein
VKLVISLLLLAISFIVIGSNWVLAVRWWIFKIKSSMIPLVGGLSGCIGLILLSWKYNLILCWVPLLLDLGTLIIPFAIIQLLFKKSK